MMLERLRPFAPRIASMPTPKRAAIDVTVSPVLIV
jgi:hypothetical protein